jgi:hypothetical protein
MSFLRHREIYPSDGGASRKADAPAHRLDEFPAGYSLAGWSPPEPASASPAGSQYEVQSSCRSRDFHRDFRFGFPARHQYTLDRLRVGL